MGGGGRVWWWGGWVGLLGMSVRSFFFCFSSSFLSRDKKKRNFFFGHLKLVKNGREGFHGKLIL